MSSKLMARRAPRAATVSTTARVTARQLARHLGLATRRGPGMATTTKPRRGRPSQGLTDGYSLRLWLTEEQHRAVEAAAQREGVGVSEWVRRACEAVLRGEAKG